MRTNCHFDHEIFTRRCFHFMIRKMTGTRWHLVYAMFILVVATVLAENRCLQMSDIGSLKYWLARNIFLTFMN